MAAIREGKSYLDNSGEVWIKRPGGYVALSGIVGRAEQMARWIEEQKIKSALARQVRQLKALQRDARQQARERQRAPVRERVRERKR